MLSFVSVVGHHLCSPSDSFVGSHALYTLFWPFCAVAKQSTGVLQCCKPLFYADNPLATKCATMKP